MSNGDGIGGTGIKGGNLSFLDILEAQLTVDEGKRNKMYLDSKGIPTIGIGHNLRDRFISERAIRVIFEDDTAQAIDDARHLFPSFDSLSDARRAVISNMSFNLGLTRLSAFHDMRAAVEAGDFDKAASEMLNSTWATQVGERAQRLAKTMKEG